MGMIRRLTRMVGAPGRPDGSNGAPGLVALDVGTEFAKVLVMSVAVGPDGRQVGQVRGAGRQRQGLAHMQSGTVSDIDAVVANCALALAQAEAMGGIKGEAAVIGIAGELVKGTTTLTTVRRADPRAAMDEDELQRIVEQVQEDALAEAERTIGWESGVERLDVRLVHAAVVEMKIDGYPVSNPIGFTGAQVEIAVFNAFAPMVHLGALQSVAQRLGLVLLGVVAEPYAVATCLDPDEIGEAGAVFIDVGGGTTDVALVRRGGIAGTKMLALGGRAFTRGLGERLGLPFARAEALKIASAQPGTLPEPIERDAVSAALAEDARVWLGGVELMIEELARGELLPGRIFLCGGGAQLPEITAALEDDAWWRRLPFARRPQVRALAPREVVGIDDATGLLTSRQDVTPMALAHQALLIISVGGAAERAMRRAVRSMEL